MSAGRPICQRCHRLRPTNSAGYCGTCSGELRAQEQRRPVQDPAAAALLTPSLAPPDEPQLTEEALDLLAPFEEAPPLAGLPVQGELPAGQPPTALFVLPSIDEDDNETRA